MRMRNIYLLGLALAFCATAPAAAKVHVPDKKANVEKFQVPPLPKGLWVTVLKLNRTRRLLEVQIDSATDRGPNLARPEDFADAVNIAEPSERKAFINEPSRFVGSKFVLEKELKLINP